MIVFVETNFLLELVYQQEEHESCEAILALAEAGRIDLVVPAFSVAEARSTLLRRIREREEFHDSLSRQIRELSRSRAYADVPARSRELLSAFLNSGEDERHRLSEALDRIVAAGRIVPLTAEVLLTAERAGNEVNLKPPDATVYASVVRELDSDPGAPKCFLNRNSRDFANPDVFAELGRGNCRLIPSFRDGLAFITNARP